MVIFYGKIHESLISKKTQESRVGRTKKRASYGTMFKAIAPKAF